MKAKNHGALIAGICMGAASLACAPSALAAGDAGWYAGAAVGMSTVANLGGIDNTLAGSGISSSSTTNRIDIAWKLLGGYQVNRHFGVEGGYADLGHSSITSSVVAPVPGAGTGTRQVNRVFSLSALGYVPLTDRLSAFGKVGFVNASTNLTYNAPGAAVSQTSSTSGPLFGVGLTVDFGGAAAMRVEYERYLNVGDASRTGQSDINVLSVGMQYRF